MRTFMTPVHKKVRRFGIPKIVFHLKIKKTLKYFINFLIRKKKIPAMPETVWETH